jgi:hypothetical protein
MSMFYYLLEANAYLLVFYFFYRTVLQKETFYSFNRFYLVTTSMTAFIMPCISISGLYASAALPNDVTGYTEEVAGWGFSDTAAIIYAAIAVCFFLRLLFRLYGISKLINQGKVTVDKGIKTVWIHNMDHTFSFMNYLFIHPETQNSTVIIRHEQVHIRQFHTLDILFFELLQTVNWFNPLIRYIQQDIKAVHEFIADEEAAVYDTSLSAYAHFLIKNACSFPSSELTNTMFNQSLLKKRIMKLSQTKSPDSARLKYGLVLLMLPLMLCITAKTFAKPYGIIDLSPSVTVSLQDTTIVAYKIKNKVPPAPPVKPRIKKVKSPVPKSVKQKKAGHKTVVKISDVSTQKMIKGELITLSDPKVIYGDPIPDKTN